MSNDKILMDNNGNPIMTPRGQMIPKMNAIWPSNYTFVTSGFNSGIRKDPLNEGKDRPHTAIDIENPMDAPVYAAINGIVKTVSSNAESGNYIKITHDQGLETSYSHTRSIVTVGQTVQKGNIIGYSDGSGRGAPHLHFVVRLNGERIDPKFIVGEPE